MNWLSLIGVGVALFAVTNIDDLFLLGLFFSDRTLRRSHVVLGQFVGLGILVAASVIAALAAVAIPAAWIATLGLVPLLLGLWKLIGLWKPDEAEETPTVAGSATLSVAGVTVANGGDNVGAYVPYLATLELWEIGVTVFVFMAMTALWCAFAILLLGHRHTANVVERFGHVALPFVLIGLGLWILAGALPLIA